MKNKIINTDFLPQCFYCVPLDQYIIATYVEFFTGSVVRSFEIDSSGYLIHEQIFRTYFIKKYKWTEKDFVYLGEL